MKIKNKKNKNQKSDIQLQNGDQETQFPSRDINFSIRNGKTTFPKEFFLEFWLIIEDCKYNYTTEIKFEKKKKLFGFTFMGKTNLEQRP